MTVLADASAVAKLFVAEAGSARVADEAGPFAISALTRVEVTSAIWMKARIGTLSAPQCARVADAFLAQLSAGRFAGGAAVFEAPIGPGLLNNAARLCGLHALRSGDAIQLATALAIRTVDPSCTRFWVFDRRLADAAAKEGFAVLGL